jgi:hypothetical protein
MHLHLTLSETIRPVYSPSLQAWSNQNQTAFLLLFGNHTRNHRIPSLRNQIRVGGALESLALCYKEKLYYYACIT